MENMDKARDLSTKMGADKLAINTLNTPKNHLPKLSAQAQKFGVSMKKDFIWCP